MKNSVKTALIAAATLCTLTSAYAEPEAFSVDILYDGDLLATEEGAATVLESIKAQAKTACTVNRAFATGKTIDRVCVRDVVAKTIVKIQEAQAEQGRDMARTFASLEGSLNGAPEQR